MTVAGLLGLIAGIAINLWLFRQGALWGILGLNFTKHMVIAYLCQVSGVNRGRIGPSEIERTSAPAVPGRVVAFEDGDSPEPSA